jgi:hypothetical protein
MDTVPELSKIGSERAAEGEAFAAGSLIPALIRSQNQDGGWGFRASLQSRVEPTSWALLALHAYSSEPDAQSAAERAYDFLRKSQLPDGSWPVASPDFSRAPQLAKNGDSPATEEKGSWVTALACWALLISGKNRDSLKRALEWLCADRPGESGFWWRLRRGLAGNANLAKQSDSYYGWSWTPGTASWVEPTSQALIVLNGAPRDVLPAAAAERTKLAESMLYDRMCIGGGWNCGNPMVYGVPGEPLVGPTVWALLALSGNLQRPPNQLSLDWLERTFGAMGSVESFALAHVGLKLCGRAGQNRPALIRKSVENRVEDLNIPNLAWAALALSLKTDWLPHR